MDVFFEIATGFVNILASFSELKPATVRTALAKRVELAFEKGKDDEDEEDDEEKDHDGLLAGVLVKKEFGKRTVWLPTVKNLNKFCLRSRYMEQVAEGLADVSPPGWLSYLGLQMDLYYREFIVSARQLSTTMSNSRWFH